MSALTPLRHASPTSSAACIGRSVLNTVSSATRRRASSTAASFSSLTRVANGLTMRTAVCTSTTVPVQTALMQLPDKEASVDDAAAEAGAVVPGEAEHVDPGERVVHADRG